jgi:hypothetical protein
MRINPLTGEPIVAADTSPEEMKQFVYNQMKREGGWFAQAMMSRQLFTTSEYADPGKQPNYKGGVVIRGSDYQLLYTLGIIIGGGLLLSHAVAVVPGIVGLLAFVAILYTLDHYVPAAHRELIFDHQGMKIQGDRIAWGDIIGTFIWTSTGDIGFGLGTATAVQLVIVDRRGSLTFYAVGGYLASAKNIAALVEYYRNQDSATA